MAKTPKKTARPARQADRRSVTRKPKPRAPRRRRRGPRTFVQFQGLLQEIDDIMALCVRGRRWSELEAALTEYAVLLGMDAPFLLFLVLHGWALRSHMTLPQAIKLLQDWDPRRDGDRAGDGVSGPNPRAEALAVFARLESAGQPVN